MKVDEEKIREIARRLGVSERTVEEYVLDRLALQQPREVLAADDAVPTAADRAAARSGVVDRFGRPLKEHVG